MEAQSLLYEALGKLEERRYVGVDSLPIRLLR
jgi:hypothetical protein